jgi:hypothetical protein
MPEENKETTTTEERKEERTEERREEPAKTEVKRDDPPERTEPPTVKCPDCHARVDADSLGSHRYAAHKVERRAKPKSDGDGDGDGKSGDQSTRTPARRKDASSGDDKGTQTTGRKGGRWSEVRGGWG